MKIIYKSDHGQYLHINMDLTLDSSNHLAYNWASQFSFLIFALFSLRYIIWSLYSHTINIMLTHTVTLKGKGSCNKICFDSSFLFSCNKKKNISYSVLSHTTFSFRAFLTVVWSMCSYLNRKLMALGLTIPFITWRI